MPKGTNQQHSGHWPLVIGDLSFIGHWSLVIGHWSLDWSLVTSHFRPGTTTYKTNALIERSSKVVGPLRVKNPTYPSSPALPEFQVKIFPPPMNRSTLESWMVSASL